MSGYPIVIHAKKRDEYNRLIDQVFYIFDRDKRKAVPVEEIGPMLRALGQYPTESALNSEIIPKMRDDKLPTTVKLPKFKSIALDIMMSRHYEPDPTDVLLEAFKKLDESKEGHLDINYLREVLTTRGDEPLTYAEVEQFLNAARDGPYSSRVYYQDYLLTTMEDRQADIRLRTEEYSS